MVGDMKQDGEQGRKQRNEWGEGVREYVNE